MKPRAGRRIVDGGLAGSVSSADDSARRTSYKLGFCCSGRALSGIASSLPIVPIYGL